MGKGYLLKIIFLICGTIFLTWYSRQGSNNPFKSQNKIEVLSSGKSLLIGYFRAEKNKTRLTVAAPFNLSGIEEILKRADSWELISGPAPIDSACCNRPPEEWSIIGSSFDTTARPVNWPVPSTGMQARTGDCQVEYVNPFSDNRQILSIKFRETLCLLADGSSFHCNQSETTPLREKSELMIIYNTEFMKAEEIRRCFRPRYMIFSGDCDGKENIYENVICTGKDNSNIVFSITRRGTLKKSRRKGH
ncbi:MAG: hypothetical protein GX556_18700 [Fibrobacter sp.]|nr:hypothetical protein [Fibrobacter sp.]